MFTQRAAKNHVALLHAWVKTEHGDRQPDFWNLKKKTGLVRYAKTIARPSKRDGSVEFVVQQEHVSLDGGKDPLVVLDELLPIQERPLKISSGETLLSRYRLVLRDGELDPKKVDAAWDKYAAKK